MEHAEHLHGPLHGPLPGPGRRRLRDLSGGLADAGLAAVVAAGILWLRPLGTDAAAHVYQRWAFLHYGFSLWDNFWYAGRYSLVNYSLLYYPLSTIGIRAVALLSLVAAAWAFSRLLVSEYGERARWSAHSFAVVWGAFALSGAYPFMLGAAFALLALVALRRERRGWFGLALILSLAASPLAFAFLLVVLLGVWAAGWRQGARRHLGTIFWVALAVAGALSLFLLFPDQGRYPFATIELLPALAFCLLGLGFTWRVPEARALRFFLTVYLLAVVASFLLPTALGANITRLRFLALPLAVLILSLRRWRPLLPALAALGLAFSWNLTPLLASYLHAAQDPSRSAAYWQPAVSYLKPRLEPGYRVEVVDTVEHWGATYLPLKGIPLARGWYRQDDFPQNAVLYKPLSRRDYQRWLHQLGVGYVVLPDAPYDYSSSNEARLIASGRSGLRMVFRNRHLEIFAVKRPSPILTGPGRPRVLSLHRSSLLLRLDRAGTFHLAVRYSPYWSSTAACVAAAPDGMVLLYAPEAGPVKLSLDVTSQGAVKALSGDADCRLVRAHPGMR